MSSFLKIWGLTMRKKLITKELREIDKLLPLYMYCGDDLEAKMLLVRRKQLLNQIYGG